MEAEKRKLENAYNFALQPAERNILGAEKLNGEQIIKALECCTRGRKSKEDRPCLDCPYNECNLVSGTSERQIKGTCLGWLMKDALALINSQEQRIKELDEENERLRAEQSKIKRKVLMEAASKFAGHSDYHGDAILCKLICMAEGKEVGVANPIDEVRKKETRADTVRKIKERFLSLLEKEYKENTPDNADHYFKNGSLMMLSIANGVIEQVAKEMLEERK